MTIQTIELSFDTDDELQYATEFRPPEPSGAGVLFIHGYRSRRAGQADYAAAIAEETGAACLTLDLAGHGDSPGERDEYTIAQHLAQVVTAHEYLASRPYVDRKRVGLVGTSFGGYLAVRAAVVLPDTPQRLLLRAPAWFPDGLENQPRHAYPSPAIRRYRNRLGSRGRFTFDHTHHATTQFEGPLTIVASGQDESMPFAVMGAYEQAAQQPTLHVIEDARHSLTEPQRAQFQAIAVDWAREL